jgi:uncharacterized protein with HEPN domain
MLRRPDVYLELALNALRRVPRYLGKRTEAEYLADDYCQSAVERQLEIGGDSLGQLRQIAPELFTRVPDGDIVVAFRNVLAHGEVGRRRIPVSALSTLARALGVSLEELLGEESGAAAK